MTSISVYLSQGVYTGQILSKSDKYIVVKLLESIIVNVLLSGSIDRVSTRYIHLDIPNCKMYVYILRDINKATQGIFEHILVEHADIALTYSTVEDHSWQEIYIH